MHYVKHYKNCKSDREKKMKLTRIKTRFFDIQSWFGYEYPMWLSPKINIVMYFLYILLSVIKPRLTSKKIIILYEFSR
jgi:hypothetical protein